MGEEGLLCLLGLILMEDLDEARATIKSGGDVDITLAQSRERFSKEWKFVVVDVIE